MSGKTQVPLDVAEPSLPVSLDERRVRVEEEKLGIERQRAVAESRFLVRHVGELIAGSIALAGVFVSVASLRSASIQKAHELDQQALAEKSRLALQIEENAQHDKALDRDYRYRFKLDMMQFIERHSAELFSEDATQIGRMQQVMLAAFPPDDVKELFSRFRITAGSAATRASWGRASKLASTVTTELERADRKSTKASTRESKVQTVTPAKPALPTAPPAVSVLVPTLTAIAPPMPMLPTPPSGPSKNAAEVKRIVAEQLGLRKADVQLEASLVDDLGADSLGLVELTLALEEQFSLDIPDEDCERLRTVADVIKYIDARR